LSTKDTAREEASTLLMEKSAGVLQYVGYVPERCSSRRARINDKMGGYDICGVWRV